MDLKYISAMVTGGASGLGKATAEALSASGAHVVVVDRDSVRGSQVADEIGGAFVEADVTDESAISHAIEVASARAPFRALVGCAGIGRAVRTLDRDGAPSKQSVFDLVVRVNLLGMFNCARLAASAMSSTAPLEDGERGAIVMTASIAAFEGQIGQVAYSASKGGLVGMTLPMARDLATTGIRVNTIAPGLFDTPIYGEGERAAATRDTLGALPLFPSRMGTGEEFASLALHALTNSYLNGTVLRLDAGVRLPPR
jgi:NAD(P)-dependent dehydrogenase (short-subunit alcohol dehydrogenase family)